MGWEGYGGGGGAVVVEVVVRATQNEQPFTI